MELFNILQSYFSYLFLEYKAEIYSSKIFGRRSGFLLLRTANLKVKLLTDPRDDFYLEVGCLDNEDWVELSVLNSYLNGENKGKLKVEEAASIFEKEIQKIEKIFSTQLAMQDLLEYRKQRAKKRFKERP